MFEKKKMFKEAIQFAARAHEGQVRKGSTVPYITHPLEAASIVCLITEDAEVRCAAVLHDVVEDARVTLSEIERKFGFKVAKLVAVESEDKSKSWLERKMTTVEKMKKEDMDTKIITLGDKLSNIRNIARDYLLLGDDFLLRFNETDKKRQGQYYLGLAEALDSLKDHETAGGFWREYLDLCHLVFGKENNE